MVEGLHSDPRVLDRRICVLRYLIDDWAQKQANHVYAVFEDGGTWTYAELRTLVVAGGAPTPPPGSALHH